MDVGIQNAMLFLDLLLLLGVLHGGEGVLLEELLHDAALLFDLGHGASCRRYTLLDHDVLELFSHITQPLLEVMAAVVLSQEFLGLLLELLQLLPSLPLGEFSGTRASLLPFLLSYLFLLRNFISQQLF